MSRTSTPVVIVNFKIYREVVGTRALSLARLCQEVADDSGVCVAVCPPLVELARVAAAVEIPVLSQHLDPLPSGSHTGWVTPESAKAAGASGTLLNHSEHRMLQLDIAAAVGSCRELGLLTVVCADSAETAATLASLRPHFIAVEPPELIGGDISVTSARPEVIEEAVREVRRIDGEIPVLCGAGVKTGEDVRRALELGTKGVLVASGVVKARDAKKSLEELVGFI